MKNNKPQESSIAWVLRNAAIWTIGTVVVVVMAFWLVDMLTEGGLSLTGLGSGLVAGGVVEWMVGLISLIPGRPPKLPELSESEGFGAGNSQVIEEQQRERLKQFERPFFVVAFLSGLTVLLIGILLRLVAL